MCCHPVVCGTASQRSQQCSRVRKVSQPVLSGNPASGSVFGIGFIGAGVILRDAAGHVSGLTTAATIWLCAALGTLCGLGYWRLLLTSTALALVILLVREPVEQADGAVLQEARRGAASVIHEACHPGVSRD
jgi:uncharacterized membrane protein YhiD involved in acid resistance